MKAKLKRDQPLKVSLEFDEAVRRVVTVKPPPEGWAKYFKSQKQTPKHQRRKRTA